MNISLPAHKIQRRVLALNGRHVASLSPTERALLQHARTYPRKFGLSIMVTEDLTAADRFGAPMVVYAQTRYENAIPQKLSYSPYWAR